MPIYEYVCEECETRFEKLVFGSAPEIICPECGCRSVQRVPSVCGFSSGGKTVTSSGSDACAGCTSHNCATCK